MFITTSLPLIAVALIQTFDALRCATHEDGHHRLDCRSEFFAFAAV